MAENPEIHILDHKVRLYQAADGFRTSLDSVFVAAACRTAKSARVLDMGCGVGGASFCLLWRVPGVHVTGVDIQQSHVDLARANIALNGAEGRADFVWTDIRAYAPPEKFDHVLCNPPYLEAGTYTESASAERAMALGHQVQSPPSIPPQAEGGIMTLKDWVDAGFTHLKSGGSLTMIHRADFTDKIILALGKRFGAVEIIPLYPKQGEAARRVIVRAIKDRRSPCILSAGIILHEADGRYTAAADAILRDGAPIG